MSNEETIYVVAGGPSLIGYDWNLLVNKRVIAVNRAFEVLPNAEVIYFSDQRFFYDFGYATDLLCHRARLITGSKTTHPRVENYTFTGASGLETLKGHLRSGNSSTYAAINLAYHLGAKTIVVLGLDMFIDGKGPTHFHDGYPTINNQRCLDKMKPFFPSLAEALLDQDITVLNANLNSDLDVFERIPLEAAHRV